MSIMRLLRALVSMAGRASGRPRRVVTAGDVAARREAEAAAAKRIREEAAELGGDPDAQVDRVSDWTGIGKGGRR